MTIEDVLSIIPKIGDGLSWLTQNIIIKLSTWGLSVTELQSKILLIILFGSLIYLLLSVITIAKKILKWGLLGAIIFLAVSVTISIFA